MLLLLLLAVFDCGFYEVTLVFSPNSVFRNCEVRLLPLFVATKLGHFSRVNLATSVSGSEFDQLPGTREVQMRIFVADNGFTSFLQGDQEEPKTFIQDLIIDVQAVNDMPYLYWVHLPPKDWMFPEVLGDVLVVFFVISV